MLMRTSLADGSTVEVYRASGRSGDHIVEAPQAGGGFVAVLVNHESRDGTGDATSVVRLNRDGSNMQIVATGKLQGDGSLDFPVRRGGAVMTDCGSEVTLEDVSGDGVLVYGVVRKTRASKSCGRQAVLNDWHYFAMSPTGETREVYAAQAVPWAKAKRGRRGGWSARCSCDAGEVDIQMSGTWLKIDAFRAGVTVRDMATGATSLPFPMRFGTNLIPSLGSVGTLGQFATLDTNVQRRRIGRRRHVTVRVDGYLFPNPADVSRRVNLGPRVPMFCGSRLFALRSGRGGVSILEELDPLLGTPSRIVGSLPSRVGTVVGCGPEFLVLSRQEKKRGIFTAYSLGPSAS